MPAEHADIAYFLAATGVRITEALQLSGRTSGQIRVDASLTIRQSKTEAGVRTIPLSPETVRRLNKRRAISRFATDADPIFPSSSGTGRSARPADPTRKRASSPTRCVRGGLVDVWRKQAAAPFSSQEKAGVCEARLLVSDLIGEAGRATGLAPAGRPLGNW
jgi:integrase